MTLELSRREDYLQLVDTRRGTVDRRIFSDQKIYEMELERIFARAWNFMAHDSQIPNPGDFFLTFIGEDRVIVVRDKDMQPQVLINSCRHRGNAVCRAEEGHATSFMCTYHGWTYDLKGNLVGVPGFKEVYHEDLKREEWGLIKAAQVDTYKGFIFATMDAEAPEFADYLGDVGRMGIDMLAERGDEMVVADGIQKYVIGCNWKFATDNVWDYYHGVTHQSAFMAQFRPGMNRATFLFVKEPSMTVLGEYGHVIGGPQVLPPTENSSPIRRDNDWRERLQAQAALGPVGLKAAGHPHIFPNFWVAYPGSGQVSLRLPRGPLKTEIWWFSFSDRRNPQRHRQDMQMAMHQFGPAGMLEQDDGENWGQSTMGTRGVVTRRYPLNYQMNLGRGQIIEDELGPPRVETVGVSEQGQLWLHRSWSEWMAAESWADLKANHSRPAGYV